MSDKLTLDELRAKVASRMGEDRVQRMVEDIDWLASWPSMPIRQTVQGEPDVASHLEITFRPEAVRGNNMWVIVIHTAREMINCYTLDDDRYITEGLLPEQLYDMIVETLERFNITALGDMIARAAGYELEA